MARRRRAMVLWNPYHERIVCFSERADFFDDLGVRDPVVCGPVRIAVGDVEHKIFRFMLVVD